MKFLLIHAMTETMGGGEYPSLNIMLRESPEEVTFKQKLVIFVFSQHYQEVG